MTNATIAQKGPYKVYVQAGKKYFWCACGLSKNQPFCDSSHIGTGISGMMWEATETREVFFCGCKQTKTPPFCDSTHSHL